MSGEIHRGEGSRLRGVLRIFHRQSRSGRIILEDGRETPVLTFPENFESGDPVEVSFVGNDPDKPILNMVSISEEWILGHVMIPHKADKPNGSILPTYPKLGNLLFYRKNDITDTSSWNEYSRHQPVRFRIRKDCSGKSRAIEIHSVCDSDVGRCSVPVFSTLTLQQEPIQTDFIKSVVTTKREDQCVVTGKIRKVCKRINERSGAEYSFGFVAPDTPDASGRDIYFKSTAFEAFYKKPPEEGESIACTIRKTEPGLTVVRFCEPVVDKELPEDEQYAITHSGVRISLSSLRQQYGKEPEEGDIVYFHQSLAGLRLMHNDSEKVRYYSLATKPNGTVKWADTQRGFGFIDSQEWGDVHFWTQDFQRTYGIDPSPGIPVKFNIKEGRDSPTGRKSRSVKNFQTIRSLCMEESFRNFTDVQKDEIYYAYLNDKGIATDVYRFNPENLSECIQCFKDRTLPNQLRLQAIDGLLAHKYSDRRKSITPEVLQKEKFDILNSLRDELLAKGDSGEALYHEVELQRMRYDPKRLACFSILQGNYTLITEQPSQITEAPREQGWLFFRDAPIAVSECPEKPTFHGLLEDRFPGEVEPAPEEPWIIDLRPSTEVEEVYPKDNFYWAFLEPAEEELA